jgi:hypothetical protein
VPLAKPQLIVRGGSLHADPAGDLLGPGPPFQPFGGGHERGLADAVLALAGPVPLVDAAQVRPARAGPLAGADHAFPPVDRMATGDLDDVVPVERVE